MPDPLAEYDTEIRAVEDQWYADHGQPNRMLGSSLWYDHEELLGDIDRRHDVRPDDPRVYSIAAFKAKQQEIHRDWRRLCAERGWQHPLPGSPDYSAFFDARARHWARRDDLIARHFPRVDHLARNPDESGIDSSRALWWHITGYLLSLARTEAASRGGPEAERPSACPPLVQQVYTLMHRLQIDGAPRPPYRGLTAHEVVDELTRIANLLERQEAACLGLDICVQTERRGTALPVNDAEGPGADNGPCALLREQAEVIEHAKRRSGGVGRRQVMREERAKRAAEKLNRAVAVLGGMSWQDPEELQRRDVARHLEAVTDAIQEVSQALRAAGLDSKWVRVDHDRTLAHYRREEHPQLAQANYAQGRALVEQALHGAPREQLRQVVADYWHDPILRRAWTWVVILLKGLARINRLAWREPADPPAPEPPEAPAKEACAAAESGAGLPDGYAPLPNQRWPLVGERSLRRDPLPELAGDPDHQRQVRYCQGFDPNWWLPAGQAANWRSHWYPLQATRESIEQWLGLIETLRVEYLGPFGRPERAAELEADRDSDLDLLSAFAPAMLEGVMVTQEVVVNPAPMTSWATDPVGTLEQLRDRVCGALDLVCEIHRQALAAAPGQGLEDVGQELHRRLHQAIVHAQAIWFDTPARRYLDRPEPVCLDSRGRPDPGGPTGSCYHDLALGVAVGLLGWVKANEPAEMLARFLRFHTAAGDDVGQYLSGLKAHVACECRQAIAQVQAQAGTPAAPDASGTAGSQGGVQTASGSSTVEQSQQQPVPHELSTLNQAEEAALELWDLLGRLAGIARQGTELPECDSREAVARSLAGWKSEAAQRMKDLQPLLQAARDAVIEARRGRRFTMEWRVESCALDMTLAVLKRALDFLSDPTTDVQAASQILYRQLQEMARGDLEDLRLELTREFAGARQEHRRWQQSAQVPQIEDGSQATDMSQDEEFVDQPLVPGEAEPESGATGDRTKVANAEPEHVIRRNCGMWHIQYLDEAGDFPVTGNKCLSHLAAVLIRPNHLFGISELVGDLEGKLEAEAHFSGDKETDLAGLVVLQRELDEVEALLELGQTDALLERKQRVLGLIKRAAKGRTLGKGSPVRKAHHNISSQIRGFIREKLEADMPQFAAHLKASIRMEFPDIGYFPPAGCPGWNA
jgi:hypothetical protein